MFFKSDPAFHIWHFDNVCRKCEISSDDFNSFSLSREPCSRHFNCTSSFTAGHWPAIHGFTCDFKWLKTSTCWRRTVAKLRAMGGPVGFFRCQPWSNLCCEAHKHSWGKKTRLSEVWWITLKVPNHQAMRAIDIFVRNCDEVNRCQRRRRLRTCCLLKLFPCL